ncbi:MAG: NAD(P)H-dependent oxidoreductase [Propionibacteriaceae bacterium]|nr:NAD(P)H-dependent oxidoreductase [Propionibacteriaceae bacterium]
MTEPHTFRLAVVSGGSSDPSSTRLLADRIIGGVTRRAGQRGHDVTTTVIELRPLAAEIAIAITSQWIGPKLAEAIATLTTADGLVVSTPVYKAGPSGLLTSFFQVLDNDLLIAKPVVLAATAGTSRHALVVDEQLRSLFAFLRTLTTPTSLFAAPEDWGDPALSKRIDRAAVELVLLMEADLAAGVREESWNSYQHQFGGATDAEIDFDSDLMRLAAGGSLG